MARRLRLWSGLILFPYVVTHLLNHALGIISLSAAETGRLVFLPIWRNPVGTVLLYGSLVTHVALVLWTIYQARHLRLPRWEVVRLGLGLAMPFLLIPHIFGTRVLNQVTDFSDTYAYVVAGMWLEHPESAVIQVVLLLVAWIHGAMGVRWWLRLRSWYPRYRAVLRALALIVPTLAIAGFVAIGREIAYRADEPGWLE